MRRGSRKPNDQNKKRKRERDSEMSAIEKLLRDCQNFLDGLDKGDFKDKGHFYAAEELRNRIRAFPLKGTSEVDTGGKKKE